MVIYKKVGIRIKGGNLNAGIINVLWNCSKNAK